MGYLRSISASLLVMLATSTAMADDWIADRVRGGVVIMQGGDWVALSRGQVVPDGGRVRTESNGRVELVRGAERISMATNTEIAIRDAGEQKMTSVIQSRGTVTVDAERRNVQHFSVQTPVLAAVVKGTQFTVTYSNGQASVSVDRGVVQVQDDGHEMVVDVTPGQTAMASQSRPVDLSGPGAEAAVYLIQGEVVPAPARAAVLSGDIAPAEAVAIVRDNPAALAGGPANGGPGNGNGKGRDDAGNGRGPDHAGGPAGPGKGNGPDKGNGPGNGNGPASRAGDAGPGNAGGNGKGQGGPGNSNGNGNGPDKSGGPGNGNGPGKSDEARSGNGADSGGGPGNGNGGPGNDSGGGPASAGDSGPGNGGPGNGNGKGSDDGPGKGHDH